MDALMIVHLFYLELLNFGQLYPCINIATGTYFLFALYLISVMEFAEAFIIINVFPLWILRVILHVIIL
jgi:hypothetical protein